jgi:hypothetical protein
MSLMPPPLLVRCAIAAVWVYEGLWCKVLGRTPYQRAIVEAVPLLVGMNANGLLFARRLIHDPAEMVVKNFVFVVLIWVAAAQGSR